MGMYDYVRCELKLPHPSVQMSSFQTKDLSCHLEIYKIDSDGKLYKRNQVWKHLNKWTNDPIMAEMLKRKRYMRREKVLVKETWDHFPFNGALKFYTTNDKNNLWYEYSLIFVDGCSYVLNVVSPKKCTKCHKIRSFWHTSHKVCSICSPWCGEHLNYGCKRKTHHKYCKEHWKYGCKEKVHKERIGT